MKASRRFPGPDARRWSLALQGYPDDGGAEAPGTSTAAGGIAPASEPVPPINPTYAQRNGHTGDGRETAGHDNAATRSNGSDRDAVYGALDLGTNNCRLLLARPSRRGFRVVDAFSRIIRLGEGVGHTGRLSPAAMARTHDALKVCAAKLDRAKVRRSRLVATEACRIAGNSGEFLAEVRDKLGLNIEVLTPEAEARLAVSGSAALIDASCDYVLVFDIGGGSSELILLDLSRRNWCRERRADRADAQNFMVAWTSLPIGVVTLAERFGGRHVTPDDFEAMVDATQRMLEPFEAEHQLAKRLQGKRLHMLGTSGTVTTIAGVHLGLPRYDRNRVDGCWLSLRDVRAVTYDLLARTYEQRIAEPCIGRDRADLVLAGCAILEAVLRLWPCERLRVADRGLREGILTTLMAEDGVLRTGRRRRGGR
jgi:exopolyphosphatase/guanosine-5'-triphosphate,3'-diphosphate pyrophosphatase